MRKFLTLLLTLTFIAASFVITPTTAFARPYPGNPALAREAGHEGSILLMNDDNTLPLPATAGVTLFGRAANYIRGGTGSGATNVPYTTNILQGMQAKNTEGKIRLNPTVYGDNNAYTVTADDVAAAAASEYNQYAIIIITRNSGENNDRSAADFNLTANESAMIDTVCAGFSNVVVVFNIGGMIDYTWEEQAAKANVKSILLHWQAGMEGGNIAADVLVGDAYPSGKLTDTIARSYNLYPGNSIGTFNISSTSSYNEDIYVGYRYFETKYPGSDNYSAVKYEFGYGLGYTTFTQSEKSVAVDEAAGTMTANVTVTNTGNRPGKEVIQVYYQAPNGALNTPARELVAFQKTRELAANESQTLSITWRIRDMTSYDENGKTGAANASSWLMEAGNFNIYVGNSVKNASLVHTYNVPQTRIYERLTRQIAPAAAFNILVDPVPGGDNVMQSSDNTAPVHGTAPAEAVDVASSDARINPETIAYTDQPSRIKFAQDQENSIFFKPANHEGVYKLTDVYYGNCTMEQFIAQMTNLEKATISSGSGAVSLAGQGGQGKIGFISRLGVPGMETNDGPAGLRLQSQTAWPIGTMLCSMWNMDLMEQVGAAIGKEMNYSGPDVYLAPGMNLHRDPRCGRNFEYYSEDPILTGKTAAAVSRGVHSEGAQVTLKHYSHNNEEGGRTTNNSITTERASREIYLKGFEIAVKEGTAANNNNPVMHIMSSYNRLNGVETAERYDLITTIPDEWGYNGLIMTDWGNNSSFVNEVRAGNDVKMSSGTISQVQNALNNGTITTEQIDRNMKDIFTAIMASKQFQRMLLVKDVPAAQAVTRIDASAFNDFSGTVRPHVLTVDDAGVTEAAYRVGGATNRSAMAANDSVSYFIDVEATDIYALNVRRSSTAAQASAYNVLVDGQQVGTLDALNTGDVQVFETQTGPSLYLTAGEHIVTFTAANAGSSLNWFELTREAGKLSIGSSGNLAAVGISDYAVTGAAENARLILAIYDESGRLISVGQSEAVAISNGQIDQILVETPMADEAYTVKAFLWDADTYTPLAESAFLQLQ